MTSFFEIAKEIVATPPASFKRGQRVVTRTLVGSQFTPSWTELATITGKHFNVSPTSGEWWVVRYDDGGSISIHETQLRDLTEAIHAEADALCVPGWATPLWRAEYATKEISA